MNLEWNGSILISLCIVSSVNFGQVSPQTEAPSVTMSPLFFRCFRFGIFVVAIWIVTAVSSMMSVPSTPWRRAVCIFLIHHLDRWSCRRDRCRWCLNRTLYSRNGFFICRQTVIGLIWFDCTLGWNISTICEWSRWGRTVYVDCVNWWPIPLSYTIKTENKKNKINSPIFRKKNQLNTIKITKPKLLIDTHHRKCPLRWGTFLRNCHCYCAHFVYSSGFEAVNQMVRFD